MRRIQGRDPELVLGVLEGCLRSVSDEIVREGRKITFFGLGPSPRAVNRRDTTILHVDSMDGVTTIHADVRFQASAFLGTAPQDAVVEAKLNRVFDDMLARLGLDAWCESRGREPEAGESQDAPAGMVSAGAEITAEQPAAEAVAGPRVEAAEEADVPGTEIAGPEAVVEPEVVASEVVADAAVESSSMKAAGEAEDAVEPEAEPVAAAPVTAAEQKGEAAATGEGAVEAREVEKEVAPAEPKREAVEVKAVEAPAAVVAPVVEESKAAEPIRKPEAIAPGRARATASASIAAASASKLIPAEPFVELERPILSHGSAKSTAEPPKSSPEEDEPEGGARWLKWSAWVAAIIVLVVAPLAWLYMPSHSAAPAGQQAHASPVAAPSATREQPKAVPVEVKQPGEDADPAVVVQDWEKAMNSTDAAAQAAFYADPVDRYFLRHNVSRNQVKADKQSSIDKRQGSWAVTMEQIKLTRPDDATARVRLVKHFAVKQEGKTTSEWFVPSVLQMTRANGRWQITSERDLGWATSLDELGY